MCPSPKQNRHIYVCINSIFFLNLTLVSYIRYILSVASLYLCYFVRFHAGRLTQFLVVLWRSFITVKRDKNALFLRTIQAVVSTQNKS